jgi:hypothetical protein
MIFYVDYDAKQIYKFIASRAETSTPPAARIFVPRRDD